MALSAFAKIDGIPGGSTDANHKDQIEVLAYSHVMRQQASLSRSHEGGATSGDVIHDPLRLTVQLGMHSPKVYQAVSDGTHIDKVVIEMVRAGKDPLTYMKVTLSNVLFTDVETASNATTENAFPTETYSLTYKSIQWDYTKQDEKGAAKGNVAAKWSLGENKASA
jgi:type VI secretion system secreted protein Hcp